MATYQVFVDDVISGNLVCVAPSLLIVIKVNPFVLKQALRLRSLKYVRSVLELLLRFVFLLHVLPGSLVDAAERQFVGDAHCVAVLDYRQPFWLLTFSLNVLSLPELFDDKVGDQRLQMVRVYLLEQRDLKQEIQPVDVGLVLSASLDDPHRVCLLNIEQVTLLHCDR